jgi:hypothetical protein
VARILLGAVALAGVVAFVALIVGRYGTPFVVAQRLGLGALVFVLGRFLLVVCHELAHGLTAESFGRPVSRAGIKTVLVFPYAFVDTTDAWFEPRRRRIAISLAGPVSDVVLGGAFAIACWFSAAGAPVAALRAVALVPEPRHQLRPGGSDPRDAPPSVCGLSAEPVARQRRTDHVECVLRGASVSGRIGERADHLEELDDRARPTVGHDQRHRPGMW